MNLSRRDGPQQSRARKGAVKIPCGRMLKSSRGRSGSSFRTRRRAGKRLRPARSPFADLLPPHSWSRSEIQT